MNKLTLETPVQGPPAPAGRPQPLQAAAAPDTQATSGTQQTGTQQTGTQEAGTQEAAGPGGKAASPAQPPRLSAAVLAQIAAALRQGEAPLAAQADLVALHKRIAEMFATLNEGLGAQATQKAAADRAALSARIDQLETAVNRMEGALRIEFEPVLKAALAEALAQAAPKPRRRWPKALAVLLLAAAALAAGAWWHAPLQDAAQAAAAALESRSGWQLPGG